MTGDKNVKKTWVDNLKEGIKIFFLGVVIAPLGWAILQGMKDSGTGGAIVVGPTVTPLVVIPFGMVAAGIPIGLWGLAIIISTLHRRYIKGYKYYKFTKSK